MNGVCYQLFVLESYINDVCYKLFVLVRNKCMLSILCPESMKLCRLSIGLHGK